MPRHTRTNTERRQKLHDRYQRICVEFMRLATHPLEKKTREKKENSKRNGVSPEKKAPRTRPTREPNDNNWLELMSINWICYGGDKHKRIFRQYIIPMMNMQIYFHWYIVGQLRQLIFNWTEPFNNFFILPWKPNSPHKKSASTFFLFASMRFFIVAVFFFSITTIALFYYDCFCHSINLLYLHRFNEWFEYSFVARW